MYSEVHIYSTVIVSALINAALSTLDDLTH